MDKPIDLTVNLVPLRPVQAVPNEPDTVIQTPKAVLPPVQAVQNEPDADYTIPLVGLKELPALQDEPLRKLVVPLTGKLITAEDPVVVGQNFRTLINMRYGDKAPKSIGGMTKINSANPMDATYLKSRNVHHFKKVQPAETSIETHVLAQAWNTGLTAAQVLQNVTAPPAVGDFDATELWTDTVRADQNPVSRQGMFSDAPNGNIAYCNGVDTCIWGGNGIPVSRFLNYDEAKTFMYDYTDIVSSADPSTTVSFTEDTGGGGGDEYVALLLHLDNSLDDDSANMAFTIDAITTTPNVGDEVIDTDTGVTGTVTVVTPPTTVIIGGYVSPGAFPYNVIPWTTSVPHAMTRTWFRLSARANLLKDYYKGICADHCPAYVRPDEWPPYEGATYTQL